MSKKKQKKKITKKSSRRKIEFVNLFAQIKLPLLLIAIAFLPRLVVLFEYSANSPIFSFPIIDSMAYHKRAIEIAAGDFLGYHTFWQAPLYSYFLGIVYCIFGVSIYLAKFLQLLIGAVNCYLIFLLAAKIFNKKIGFIAFIISVLFGPAIFFEAQLLAPVLLNFLILVSLLLIISSFNNYSIWKIILIGVLLGLAQLGHGLIIVFVLFLALYLIFFSKDQKLNSYKWRYLIFLVVGFLPIILIVTVRNYSLDKEIVFVSSNFGHNFYLGNHPNYDSTTAIRPGLEWDEFIQEAVVEGNTTQASASKYYTSKAIDNILIRPIDYLGLLIKKLYLLTAGEEIKRNLDIYHFSNYSILLTILIWSAVLKFPSGLIIPLSLAWILLFVFKKININNRQSLNLLFVFLLSQTLAMLLFFISTRYRLPLMPILIIFTGAMIYQIYEWLIAKENKLLTTAALLLIALLVFCNIPRIDLTSKDLAENFLYEGLAYDNSDDHNKARQYYLQALELKPDYVMAEYNLAINYRRRGNNNEYKKQLSEIIENNPKSFMAYLTVGKAYLDIGNNNRAEQLFRDALQRNPNSTEVLLNLGVIARNKGDINLATGYFNKALKINPRNARAYSQIGATYMQQNQTVQAEQNFKKAYQLNPSYLSAINNLATIYAGTNRIDEAMELMSHSIKLAPDDVNTLLNYGALYTKKNEPTKALEYFDRAVKSAPELAKAHYYRGVALMGVRRNNDAITAFKETLRLNPSHQQARDRLKELGQ